LRNRGPCYKGRAFYSPRSLEQVTFSCAGPWSIFTFCDRESVSRRGCVEAYAIDLRTRVLGADDRGEGTQAQLAERFEVSTRWIQELARQRRRQGSLAPRPRPSGRKAKTRGEKLVWLQEALAQTPDASREELRDACGVDGSPRGVFRALPRLQITRKERRCTPPSNRARRFKSNADKGGEKRQGSLRGVSNSSTKPAPKPSRRAGTAERRVGNASAHSSPMGAGSLGL
jgi:transposase